MIGQLCGDLKGCKIDTPLSSSLFFILLTTVSVTFHVNKQVLHYEWLQGGTGRCAVYTIHGVETTKTHKRQREIREAAGSTQEEAMTEHPTSSEDIQNIQKTFYTCDVV